MSKTHRLKFPIDAATARTLRAGDLVIMDGQITITAGLPTHERIVDYLARGQTLPTDLRGRTLFHLGSYSEDVGGKFNVRYMNPTTSTRFNALMPGLIRKLDLHAVGGKGGLDAESARAMQEIGCVYLAFLGGGCTLLSRAIRSVVSVAWDDLIAHYRLVTLDVAELGPTTVGIDAHGNNLYEGSRASATARLPELMRMLASERGGK